MLFDINRLY